MDLAPPFDVVVIDGEEVAGAEAGVSVFDIGLVRGYGCFETLRSYDGRAFRLGHHLDRLERSAAMLDIALPDRDSIGAWITDRAAKAGECMVRVMVTGGTSPAHPGEQSRVIIYAAPLHESEGPLRVLPTEAPWHSDAATSELTGAKTLSYAPNLAATLAAVRDGYDDALLVGRSGMVLEGPTFGIAWVIDGSVETPALDLGILESITRIAMLEVAAGMAVPVAEGRFELSRLLHADEVFAMSTTKDLMAVGAVGDRAFEPGPVTQMLAEGFTRLVAAELVGE